VVLIHFRQRDGSWLWIKPSFYDPQCEINLSGSVLKQRKAFDLLEAGAKMSQSALATTASRDVQRAPSGVTNC
jgi:hypothetical protein